VETNRLRTLVCLCQCSVKCSSEWCIQVVNKINIVVLCYKGGTLEGVHRQNLEKLCSKITTLCSVQYIALTINNA
jgi:hypothetical protein